MPIWNLASVEPLPAQGYQEASFQLAAVMTEYAITSGEGHAFQGPGSLDVSPSLNIF